MPQCRLHIQQQKGMLGIDSMASKSTGRRCSCTTHHSIKISRKGTLRGCLGNFALIKREKKALSNFLLSTRRRDCGNQPCSSISGTHPQVSNPVYPVPLTQIISPVLLQSCSNWGAGWDLTISIVEGNSPKTPHAAVQAPGNRVRMNHAWTWLLGHARARDGTSLRLQMTRLSDDAPSAKQGRCPHRGYQGVSGTRVERGWRGLFPRTLSLTAWALTQEQSLRLPASAPCWPDSSTQSAFHLADFGHTSEAWKRCQCQPLLLKPYRVKINGDNVWNHYQHSRYSGRVPFCSCNMNARNGH